MKKVGETTIPKTEDEFDAEDIKKVENYAKAINMIYCAVNPDDYRKISCCTTAKEMWDKLEVTYEGTDQNKIRTKRTYQFRMKEVEKLDDMFDRFSKIINDLHALKKTYTNKDLVRKILRSLTPEWRSKADAIYESIRVSNVTIDGLRGNLKTYESTILNPSLNDQKKGIALKVVKESTMNDSSDDDEVKFVMKKFCKLLRKNEKVEDGPVCYGCGVAGHIRNRCPRSGRNARQFKRQRAYISWGGDSGDESTDQDEDETANLCLMAHGDQTDDVQEVKENVEPPSRQPSKAQHKSRAAPSGKSKSKSRAPSTNSEERLYYGDGSYLWFDSEEERTRFLTFFSKRVVAPPRIVPEHFPELQGNDNLDAQLHQAGLWPFVSRTRKEINPALIRVFYSNLRHEGDVLYSLVKSTPIELSVKQLERIAGLPYQGDDVSHYAGEDWVLNNEGLILNELGITELILAASTDHDHLLLYPFVVMDILERFKVTTTGGPLTKATKIWAIGTQTFKMRSDNAGPATATAAPRRCSAAGPAEPQARANLASIADSLNRLHFKVDGMDGYLERHAMNAYFQRLNYVPPPYQGTFLGQVYGDEDKEDGSYTPSNSLDEDEFDDTIDGNEMDVDDDEEETEDED
ncbi:unnamed protein product [Cuscuta campestris]|uniref:CCHC-type domain-containing protein n=1 Tax=Cuscuta campestris TaxID=132261 RepID=A0A484MHG2_9ASTE|nr:unnamed protein product [Cuscuta campestris]